MLQDAAWSREDQAQKARAQIWRHVSPAAARTALVLPLASALLRLPRRDTRFLTSLHLLLSSECTELLERAPGLVRHLTTSTTAALDDHPERVRGPVDWPATLSTSAARGRRYAYVTRPLERDYATPENRLLVGALRAVHDAACAVGWQPTKEGTSQEVDAKGAAALHLLGSSGLGRSIAGPEPRDLRRVERGRAARRFGAVSRFYRLFDRLTRLQDLSLLRAMVESTALLVTSDGAVLELLVLFDVLDALHHQGWATAGLSLVRGKVLIPHHTRGEAVLDVHYQGVPSGLPSRYSRVLKAHAVPTGGLRPDLVLDERRPEGRFVTVVEVKYRPQATEAARQALFDLLAYKDSYQGASATLRLLGVGWGQGLPPQPSAEVLLCSPDYIAEAVSVLHPCTDPNPR